MFSELFAIVGIARLKSILLYIPQNYINEIILVN